MHVFQALRTKVLITLCFLQGTCTKRRHGTALARRRHSNTNRAKRNPLILQGSSKPRPFPLGAVGMKIAGPDRFFSKKYFPLGGRNKT